MAVGLVIVSHSAQLAEGIAALAGQMSQGKTPIATAGGTGNDVIGTSVERITAAIQSVEGPDGVLILLDLGSAILSTEMALEMLDADRQGRIRISFAPLVEGAVIAALEASLGRTLAQVLEAAENTASAEHLKSLKPLSRAEEISVQKPVAPEEKSPAVASTLEATLVLTNPTGLHARPASLFVQTAHNFASHIRVAGHGRESDASSIIGILSLGLRQGDTFTIHANGADAKAAIEALSTLVQADFYETLPTDETSVDTSPAKLASIASAPENIALQPGEPWRGISTSEGIAVGPAFLFTSAAASLNAVESHPISADQVASEQTRLREALNSAAQELRSISVNLQSSIGRSQAAILDAQALMLLDPALLEATSRIIQTEQVDAASALAKAGESYAATLEALADPLLAARAADVRDAVSRAIARTGGEVTPGQALNALDHPCIIISRDLTPSDTAQLPPEFVLGICTVQGGSTAHAAILARALGIPAMAGLPETALQIIRTGDELGLDANNALLYLHPLPEIRDPLMHRLIAQQEQRALLKSAAQKAPARLIVDGRQVHLMANIGSEAEAEAARQWGAQGIGLLRTEFLFARTVTLPGEEQQRQLYAQVFRAFNGAASTQGKPVVVRTLDAGADKPMPALRDILVDEANPALGLRGIRIQLAHPHLLEQQIGALLLAAADTRTHLRIMFPMITTIEELRIARSIFEGTSERLKNRLGNLPATVLVGMMVEVPAAAIMAREFVELVDFFSIGVNDLLQYTLASDRTNMSVSGLYTAMQPAVLRLIHQIALAGREADKPVAVCGEVASDVRLAPILVGLGVDELSMTPTALPNVRNALQRVSTQKLSELAERMLQFKTVAEVEQAIIELQM